MSLFGVADGIIENKFPDGSESAPAVAFLSDPDTGMYLESPGVVAFSTSGVKRLRISDELTFNTPSQISAFFVNDAQGVFSSLQTTIAPSINTTAALNVFTASGTSLLRVDTTNSQVLVNGGTFATPGLSIINDPDTGLFSSTANTIGVACGGSPIATINSSGISFTNVTSTSTGNTSGALVTTVTLSYKIVGGQKMLYIPSLTWSGGANSTLVFATLPVEIRPAFNQDFPTRVFANNIGAVGLITINTAGNITTYSDILGSNFPAAVNNGLNGATFTYF